MNGSNPRKGFILVTVLWAIALISALAMAASTNFRGLANIVALDRDRTRADALLKAGLELSGGIVAKLDDSALTERDTQIIASAGAVQIHLSDEGGRIDINKAPVKVLSSLLRSAGAGQDADLIAKSIDALRLQDAGGQSPAAPQQANASPASPGQPPQSSNTKNDNSLRPFTDIHQLAQISGMTPAYLSAIIPLATVFGSDKVNAITASADVLAALPGLSETQLSAFLAARGKSSAAGDWLEQLLSGAKDFVSWQARPVALAELTVTLADGYTTGAKAVIVTVPDDRQPYRVLSWTPVRGSERRIARIGNQF
jgi:general secretion pathway protein K